MKRLRPDCRRGGFSLVELLVAGAIGAAVITAAVIGFAVISGAATRGGRVDVQLPGATHVNLYGAEAGSVTVWPNPGYAEAAKARLLRDKLMEDVSASTAVFCLGRNDAGVVRAGAVSFDAGDDLRTVASPTAFRQFLVDNGVDGAAAFAEDQTGPLSTTNATIFIVGGLESQNLASGGSNALRMLAAYEIDFIPTTAPAGTYVSVRRYGPDSAAVPTDYYHAFYPGEDNGTGGFRPLAVHFGRQAGGGTYDVAPNYPFTFVWWPDPLVSNLGGAAVPASGGQPLRSGYANMAGRTSLFTVLPTFPGQ